MQGLGSSGVGGPNGLGNTENGALSVQHPAHHTLASSARNAAGVMKTELVQAQEEPSEEVDNPSDFGSEAFQMSTTNEARPLVLTSVSLICLMQRSFS